MDRFLNILQVICIVFLTLILTLNAIFKITDNGLFDEKQHQKKQTEEYEKFKEDTELIKGKVVKSEVQKHFVFSDKYNLIVKSNNNETKMLKVTEQQYRNYQNGSEVNFRIDTTNQNEVIIDLKEDKDVNSVKAYMKFNESEFNFIS
ncbi:hypothetical protein BUY99_05215 [Staphylococcus gallinarum]|uniref:hypothetical protein n=1 Tax=Staphylococcus TaxID=1279 RepID=UPI000E69C537|nr:hypothetical protein [Staphylococcus gallinarum]RIL23389.1 hypothetical protein BUY99_05215 [Staphylococcus gallinarum]